MANYKKLIILLLAIGLVAPNVLLLRPKKSDAIVSCLLGSVGGKALRKINSVVSSIMAVPTSDKGTQANTDATAGSTAETSFKNCVMDSLVRVWVNTMIRNFSQSVVSWINSGFKGSPTFISNPSGFFSKWADQAIGMEIESLGAIGQILCSPFDLQLRLSLTFLYSKTYRDEIHCKLSDVQKNVYNAFVAGNFGAQGWSNWISVSAPSSNAYGVFIQASNSYNQRMVSKINEKLNIANWGGGFLSQTVCDAYLIDKTTNGPKVGPDGQNVCMPGKERVVTPGSFIEGQLNQAVGSENRKLEVAREIDEILTALVNQALTQVFSAAGLLGSGGGGEDSGSYLASLSNQYQQQQLEASQATLPAGIYCDRSYQIHPKDNSTVRIWSPAVPGTAATTSQYLDTTIRKTPPTDSNARYLQKIQQACMNLQLDQGAAFKGAGLTGTGAYDATTTPDGTTTVPDTNIGREIPLSSAALNQSSVASADGAPRGPQNAAGGFGYSQTFDDVPGWWSASLNQSEQIQSLKIRSYGGYGEGLQVIFANLSADKIGAPVTRSDFLGTPPCNPISSTCNVVMKYYLTDRSNKFPSDIVSSGPDGNFILTFNTPVTANAILISRYGGLLLEEVKAFRPAPTSARPGLTSPSQPSPSTRIDVNPPEIAVRASKNDSQDRNTGQILPTSIEKIFTVTSQSNIPSDIYGTAKIEKITATGAVPADLRKIIDIEYDAATGKPLSGITLYYGIGTNFLGSVDRRAILEPNTLIDGLFKPFDLRIWGGKMVLVQQIVKLNMREADLGDYKLTIELKNSLDIPIASFITKFTIAL